MNRGLNWAYFMFKTCLRKYFRYVQMMSFVFETIIEFSAAITCSNICAQFVLMYRGLTSTYIMLIWMLLTMAPADLFVPRGTRVLVDNIFVVFAGKVRRKTAFQWVRIEPLFLPTSFWFQTKRISYSLCSQRERTVSISVQSHLQVHQWCIVNKQPRIR